LSSRRERLGDSYRDALTPDKPAGRDVSVAYPPDPLDEREVAPPVATPHRVKQVPGAGEETMKRNTIEVLLFRALSTPLAFLLIVVQSHFLHASGRGTIVLTVLTVTVFSRLLGDLGTATTNEIREGEEDVGHLTAGALRLGLGLGLACSVVVIAVGTAASDVGLDLAIIAALALVPSVVTRTLSGVLLGLARIRLWNYLQVTPAVVSITGFFVLVVGLDLGVRGAIVAWTLGHATAALIGVISTGPLWWPWLLKRRPRGSARELLRLALAMGAANVITLASYRIELFILDRFEPRDEVGIYSIAVAVAESLWLVTTAFATAVWAPALHESEERATLLIARSALKALLFIGAVAVVAALLIPLLVPLIFRREEFTDAVGPALLLLPGVVLYGPVAILTVYLSARRGRAVLALAGPVVSLVVTTALAFALIPGEGTKGAALASSAGYVVSALVAWIVFIRVAGMGWLGRLRVAQA
jgi:O-antigen/teichoic acid export membrane protein